VPNYSAVVAAFERFEMTGILAYYSKMVGESEVKGKYSNSLSEL
jgi:hypothetical protein